MSNGIKLLARSTAAESSHWQAGKRVLACLRPEEARADPLPATNHLQGRVQLIEYVGRAYESLVRMEDESGVQLLVHSVQRPEAGLLLDFGVQPEHLLLFPDPEANDDDPDTQNDDPKDPTGTRPALRARL
ncbi:MAG TPA: TOBE domain-containing protein [Ktedonobacteraceae bacterium]|jgi:hypothetical protein